MTTATINSGDDASQYVEQVYDKHYSRLQYYFLRQLGNVSDADACVRETICRLFVFMESHRWEEEVDFIGVYLMRIAGILCLQKLTEKKSQRVDEFDEDKNQNSLFNKLRDESIQSIKERLQFKRCFPGPKEEAQMAA